MGKVDILGFLESTEQVGKEIMGYPVLGTDKEISRFATEVDGFLVTVGQIESSWTRRRLFDLIGVGGGRHFSYSAPDAFIDPSATIGKGTIVMHRTVVNACSAIGPNCIINTGAIVEHDAFIGDNVHISTGAIVNGGCRVGSGSFIGSGSVLRNHLSIGDNVVIGAGSVVVKDIMEAGTYIGNPARRLK
jgi:sugar O-acyltransferase (sialic acid O-acetyltransferase NeuD family)